MELGFCEVANKEEIKSTPGRMQRTQCWSSLSTSSSWSRDISTVDNGGVKGEGGECIGHRCVRASGWYQSRSRPEAFCQYWAWPLTLATVLQSPNIAIADISSDENTSFLLITVANIYKFSTQRSIPLCFLHLQISITPDTKYVVRIYIMQFQ